MKTKRADQIKVGDKIIRCGNILKVLEVARGKHPRLNIETIKITHERAIISYVPSHKVEVAS